MKILLTILLFTASFASFVLALYFLSRYMIKEAEKGVNMKNCIKIVIILLTFTCLSCTKLPLTVETFYYEDGKHYLTGTVDSKEYSYKPNKRQFEHYSGYLFMLDTTVLWENPSYIIVVPKRKLK